MRAAKTGLTFLCVAPQAFVALEEVVKKLDVQLERYTREILELDEVKPKKTACDYTDVRISPSAFAHCLVDARLINLRSGLLPGYRALLSL